MLEAEFFSVRITVIVTGNLSGERLALRSPPMIFSDEVN